ncbi:TetR/AcrR family transcriptional regulator [Corynebacterium freneyi]|uniref:TetR/AcrR family transcriptional regulator n=1 Tax=Corynebacterium freneyi TaxID=134034 RepID=UPI001EF30971|nr:TetR family transcriptional regulator [Corynebacterium freneyi]MCG7439937.1 TetR/AcrR family transcriptional regulator [Corynebacterium freneyi]
MTKKLTAREKILAATENILATEGLLAVNTNRIADEAKVNISTLYKNFSNKVDILAELLRNFEDARTEYIGSWAGLIESHDDWQRWADDIVRSMAEFRADRPAANQLRAAIKVHPELAEIDARSTQSAVDLMVAHLPPPIDDDARDSLTSILELASQTISMVLDDVPADTDEGHQRISALVAFISASYEAISNLVVPAATSAGPRD